MIRPLLAPLLLLLPSLAGAVPLADLHSRSETELEACSERCEGPRRVHEEAEALQLRIAAAEKAVGELEAGSPDAAAVEAAALAAGAVLEEFRRLSHSLDDLGAGAQETDVRRYVDGLGASLARLRDRLQALRQRVGGGRFVAEGGEGARTVAAGVLTLPKVSGSVSILSAPAPVEVAGGGTPKPVVADLNASVKGKPPIRVPAPGRDSEAWTQEAEAVAGILAKAERGETLRGGDPVGRGRLVHRQNGGTCAVVAQLQVLRAFGLAPPGSMSSQEDALYKEAVAKGYVWGDRRTGGSSWEFTSSLLEDRGLIVTSHAGASEQTLTEALLAGKIVIVHLATDVVWHDAGFRGASHAVVATGVEADLRTRRALGFYINDSDDGRYHAAGRLVPRETFLEAWMQRGSLFYEAQ